MFHNEIMVYLPSALGVARFAAERALASLCPLAPLGALACSSTLLSAAMGRLDFAAVRPLGRRTKCLSRFDHILSQRYYSPERARAANPRGLGGTAKLDRAGAGQQAGAGAGQQAQEQGCAQVQQALAQHLRQA